MSWNRKHRPTKVAELHLESVRNQLQKLLESGHLPQALLFAGPKGTGKTSTARVIGAILNDPANEEVVENIYLKKSKKSQSKKNSVLQDLVADSSLSQQIFSGQSYVVQELDAASHRGIDDVRSLKEKLALPPSVGLMTVYILDEVHMFTTEAFNALLKMIEEPPPHVVFILATTELHKIPATIVSRCQVIAFHKANPAELLEALTQVAEKEKLKYEKEALATIADQADGSFRDAIKVLELVGKTGSVTQTNLEKFGIASVQTELTDLLKVLLDKNEKGVTSIFAKLRQRSVAPDYFIKSLLSFLHSDLITALQKGSDKAKLKPAVSRFLLHEFCDPFVTTPSPIPLLPLEIKALEIIDRSRQQSPPKKSLRGKQPAQYDHSDQSAQSDQSAGPTQSTRKTKNQVEVRNDIKNNQVETRPSSNTTVLNLSNNGHLGDGSRLCKRWEELVQRVSDHNVAMAALLRSAQPSSGEKGSVTIKVYYKFHQEQISDPKFLALIQDDVYQLAGGNLKLTVVLTKPSSNVELVQAPTNHPQDKPGATDLAQIASEALM